MNILLDVVLDIVLGAFLVVVALGLAALVLVSISFVRGYAVCS
jgi:hypothetical protein